MGELQKISAEGTISIKKMRGWDQFREPKKRGQIAYDETEKLAKVSLCQDIPSFCDKSFGL